VIKYFNIGNKIVTDFNKVLLTFFAVFILFLEPYSHHLFFFFLLFNLLQFALCTEDVI
jgi:hypothetical protein